MTHRHLSLTIALASVALAACASGPADRGGIYDPALEETVRAQRAAMAEAEAKLGDFNMVLLNLDKSIDKFVEATARNDFQRADRLAHSLEDYLRKTVTKHIDALIVTADDRTENSGANRARAVGALGFYVPGEDGPARDVLNPLLNAARDGDDAVITNAVFSLGMLGDPDTPIDVLAGILEDQQRPAKMRIGAAWSLLRLQRNLLEPRAVAPVWMRLLTQAEHDPEPWVIIQSLRGLGKLRNSAHAEIPTDYLTHPTPLVRQAAAIALGYMGNSEASEPLIARLGPEESNANVRLTIRKALQALAGGTDRGYDQKEWRRVFAQ